MSIVCCLIHEMRVSTRLWYSSHLESTSCGARGPLQSSAARQVSAGQRQSPEGPKVLPSHLWGGSFPCTSLL